MWLYSRLARCMVIMHYLMTRCSGPAGRYYFFFLSLSFFVFLAAVQLHSDVITPRHTVTQVPFFCRRLEVGFASFIIRNVVNCPWYTVPRLPPFVFSFLFSTFVPVTLHKTGRKIIYITQLEQEWQLNKLTLGQVYGVSLVSLKFQVVIV